MMTMKKTLLGIMLFFGLGLASQAQTAAGNPSKKNKKKAAAALVPKGGDRHVYKKIGDVELPLYVYTPEEPKAKAPAIVFFFGGGWRSGSPSQFEHHCKHFASRGMVAITVEYRVSSRHDVKVEDCIEDAKSAMRWVRGNAEMLGIDPDRIASSGGSAGGHLAACTALIDDFDAKSDDLKISAKPNAMVLFNPAMGWAIYPKEANSRAHGEIKKAMPLTYASKKQPPCIIFFGTADKLLQGAKLFRTQSEKAGNQCKIVTYDKQGHGFFNHARSDGKYFKLTISETEKFLAGLGWLAPK
jgi:acetyl esterase/lipase